MELKTKLVELRKKSGLSQMELADKLEISWQAISRWEVGIAKPSTDNLTCLSRLYGVTLEYLLNDNQCELEKKEEIIIKTKNWKERLLKSKIIVSGIIVFLCFFTIIFIIFSQAFKEKDQNLPMEDLEGEDVEIIVQNDFDLEW